MLKTFRSIFSSSKICWRTFCVLCLAVFGLEAQYVNNQYNQPAYPNWNQPRPLPGGYPQGYQNPYPPPQTNLETFSEERQFNEPEFSEDHGSQGRSFSTVHKYDIVTPGAKTTPEKNTPLFGGKIDGPIRLERSKSPYLVREDIIIDRNGEMVIEPGVVVKFAPMVGITVRGVLDIQGLPNNRVILTSMDHPTTSTEKSDIRLVDGPSILTGRVQIFHKGKWRSVCTNSKNWTRTDLETACRQLGFQGGEWWGWINREPGISKPRLLYERPGCVGTERNLFECQWNTRQLGSGVCDYHPDLGISCLPAHASNTATVHHWRGVRFENAKFDKRLRHSSTLYVPESKSTMRNVDVLYAGSGRDYNATSAVVVVGVPPVMSSLNVLHSAYNGINVTQPEAPVFLVNSTVRGNRGYGLFVNSSYGNVFVENTAVSNNGGDGIRYVRHDPNLGDHFDRISSYDFCMIPTTASQTYPISVWMQQNSFNPSTKECHQVFRTAYGKVLTFEVDYIAASENDRAHISLYDGPYASDTLLAEISIKNNSKPQTLVTNRNALHVSFKAMPLTSLLIYVRITAGDTKKYDLNVTGSSLADNNGRGIAVEYLKSSVHIHQSSVSNNKHIAGVHILNGAGDINITESRIAFNQGDGVNISYTGGARNITKSVISSNKGYGFAVWLNDTKEEFTSFRQETVISYSELFKNELSGIFVGNFCGDSIVNITGNWFNESLDNAIEVQSCWLKNSRPTVLQIGHNVFTKNEKLGIKIVPALNLQGKIEYNHINEHTYGGILIKNLINNEERFDFDLLPTNLIIQFNELQNNKGIYVVNIGLTPYSDVQRILFTRNFVRYNKIKEPFDKVQEYTEEGKIRLVSRSRVAAPIVISSSNVDVFRNIIQNHESKYEIGSHLEDQSKVLNCTFNWLGYSQEEKFYYRLFHRKDRYNLAKIEYLPYLLHSSNPATLTTMVNPFFVPQFLTPGTNLVGGEVDGIESLRAGEYIVERDINIRPGGKLTLHSGVILRFPPSVGLMVAGRLEARGGGPNSILFTLKEERIERNDDTTEPAFLQNDDVNVRLLGGKNEREGRLQVKIDGRWGTVCNYGWTIVNAALVCHQLGLVLNPNDWYLERNVIPLAGTSEDVLLSNVQCTKEDLDITKCRAERAEDFENSCSHDNDVGVRCYDPVWAGVRFGVLSEPTTLQFVTIEKAGLLDYATNTFTPALQFDLARHSLENVRVVSNSHDGLGIYYSDLYSSGASNTIRNSEFSNNRGSGISSKQLGFTVIGSVIENNNYAGIRHNPSIPEKGQRELAGWFVERPDPYVYQPVFVPHSSHFNLEDSESKYVITQKIPETSDSIEKVFNIHVKPGYVVGIQLLNPINNRSTEEILIYDSQSLTGYSKVWDLRKDLNVFPTISTSFGVVVKYSSGTRALGGCVIMVSSVRAPLSTLNGIPHEFLPAATIKDTKIKGNERGIWASFYNRYVDDYGDYYLRKANESVTLLNCEISHNKQEAIYVDSPYWNVHRSNLSEISFVINSTLVIDNGRGMYQFSRDVRQSNNLFHWFLHDNSIERNSFGGFEVTLPYVWQYNENFTHSIFFLNNTFRGNNQFSVIIDGHYANVTMADNLFVENKCRMGLISFRGMEKRMEINSNNIERNAGFFMVEFHIDSQSEILGFVPASFRDNVVKRNMQQNFLSSKSLQQSNRMPSFVIGFHGIQDVRINNNLFGDNSLDYELIAGIRTAKLETYVDVSQNWWGSNDINVIKEKIFDFDDWNNHAIANFRPYLTEDRINGSLSVSWETPSVFDIRDIGGRIKEDLVIYPRDEPYVVRKDITIMPGVTVTIGPGVVMEFEPNVGILVLGTLRAQGRKHREIIMRPVTLPNPLDRLLKSESLYIPSVRLCTGDSCNLEGQKPLNHGFLEYYNRTTMQWVPVCDDRFTERNAQVVCKELGFDSLNVRFDLGPRVEFHPNSLTRIWSYPEPLQCTGNEERLEECEIRLNGQQYNHIHRCEWNSNFVFIHCGERNLPGHMLYWGGIRFANGKFEQNFYEHRIHDFVTHESARKRESVLEFVNITGAGILHNEKSPAVQAIVKSPQLNNLNITYCAHDGVNLISPSDQIRLLFSSIQHNLGAGVSVLSLTGEGRASEESSFTPLKKASLPYHIFSFVDMCDTNKELLVEERVLVYFKYDNVPVNCVKIFRSVVKGFGFRLLQFNLYNSTTKPGRPDTISLYDGSIYNFSAPLISTIEFGSPLERRLIKTTGPSLSVRLFANGASNVHGFIAEVVTLPISAIGFNRDVQHNISYSVISNNERGGVVYQSAGEVNPTLTLEWNQFTHNCKHLYGNFTTCDAAVQMDVQNPQNFYFRNNLVKQNQGGLHLKTDSRGSATALKGWIYNNLWTENWNMPVLHVEGQKNSAYQEVTVFRNFFSRNFAPYENTIIFKQVISNFTYNFLQYNKGAYILEVSGFEKVRLPIYQSTTHNGFYHNYGMNRDDHGTILAGTAGQHYVDNIFYNPDNDYEIVTVNRSLAGLDTYSSLELWKTPIDAKHNWWGFNETLAVSGRIKDRLDEPDLLEVDFQPFLQSNRSILDVKCPPGWMLVKDTCYIYIGAPMSFHDAKAFCQINNASMPYIIGNYIQLYQFLRSQQDTYQFYDRVWVQHLDKINQCTVFTYQTIEVDECERLSPFLCEIDPEVTINLLFWKDDAVTVAILGVVAATLLLMGVILVFWFTKSRKRHAERLERRNSIRQSLRSLKSIGSTNGLSDISYRQNVSTSQKSSPTLAKEYKKMMNGSLDSLEKCQYNSSIDDNQSYDIYEAHNPSLSSRWDRPQASFDLTYQNKGFRDNSTFASRENNAFTEANTPQDYYEAGTLPLGGSIANTDSIADMKHEISPSSDFDNASSYRPNDFYVHTPTSERTDNLLTPGSDITESNYYYKNPPPMQTYYDYNNSVLDINKQRHSKESLLETNIDDEKTHVHLLPKSKSEAVLETNFEVYDVGLPEVNEGLSLTSRSKSQPLETSM